MLHLLTSHILGGEWVFVASPFDKVRPDVASLAIALQLSVNGYLTYYAVAPLSQNIDCTANNCRR